jgi:hypothetical protein
MDYEQLKTGVKEIAEIAASVPEQFRDKCFEILLSTLLRQQLPAERREEVKEKTPDKPDNSTGGADKVLKSNIPMTTQLRLLMKKTEVTVEELDRVLMYDKEEVHFVKEPHDVGIATGQMEWALLLALKNAILKDSMSADPEDVRSICQAKGFYDKANFATNFKSAKNAKLFKTVLAPQGPAEPLSSDGQDALGRLIKRLAGESQ